MSILTLSTPSDRPLAPLIRTAPSSELRRPKASVRYTQTRLVAFEAKYHTSTDDLVARYSRNEVVETLETIEWLGEYRMARDIEQQIETLQAVQFDRR